MHEIWFYRDERGKSPIEDFLDTLDTKQALKVTWVLRLIEEHENISTKYSRKIISSDGIWEVRVQSGSNIIRLMCFICREKILVLTNGFYKKTQKIPRNEIKLAEKRKAEWLRRNA